MAKLSMRLEFDTTRPMGPQVLAAFIAGIPDKVVMALTGRSERTLRNWRATAETPDPATVTFHVEQDVAGFPASQTSGGARTV